MKKLSIFLMVLVALAVFAIPALGAADPVDVSINVPALSTFAAGNDVTLIPDATDLDNTYVFEKDNSTMTLQDNTDSWTLTAQLSALFTTYELWIEDSQDAGAADGSGFTKIIAASATALSNFAGYGTKGDYTYALDWLATGLSWDTAPSDQTKTVTFTHTT